MIREQYDVDAFRPTLDIDAVVEPSELHEGVVEDLQELAPFGTDHDEPLVLVEGVVIDEFEQFGDDAEHWKAYPEEGNFELLDWGGDALPAMESHRPYDTVGTVSLDGWAGTVAVSVEAVRNGR